MWKLRNDVQHGENPEDRLKIRKEQAQAELKSVYDKSKLCVPSDLKFLKSSWEVHMESKELHQIENWLQFYRGLFKKSMKQAKKTAIANTKSMQKYFITTHKAIKRKQPLLITRNRKRQKVFKSARRTTTPILKNYFSARTTQHKERNLEVSANHAVQTFFWPHR